MRTEITIVFSRLEMQWFGRQIRATKDRLHGKMNTQEETGPMRSDYEFFVKLDGNITDQLAEGERERIRLLNLRKDLEEAIELCEEGSAVIEARKRLDNLPREEEYRVTFGRDQLKLTLKTLDKDIQFIRGKMIPQYEARDASEFKDPIETKSYYINKAKRAKALLEELKKKLEKELHAG